MADPDIVVRLRQGWLAHWDTDVRFVMVYASEWVRLTNLTTESADEIERLRAERDEARRMCCEQAAMDESGYVKHGDMLHFAESRGWDCFQQEDNK